MEIFLKMITILQKTMDYRVFKSRRMIRLVGTVMRRREARTRR